MSVPADNVDRLPSLRSQSQAIIIITTTTNPHVVIIKIVIFFNIFVIISIFKLHLICMDYKFVARNIREMKVSRCHPLIGHSLFLLKTWRQKAC